MLDFGGQYCHLISRRIRDFGVYAEVLPAETKKKDLEGTEGLKGIILSGGAASVYDKLSPKCDRGILELEVPILGICYGHQLIAFLQGGKIVLEKKGEYGTTKLEIQKDTPLFGNLEKETYVWMNHRDIVKELPDSYRITASTANSPIAAFESVEKRIYGLQFHPEVTHTKQGIRILKNFVFQICGVKRDWQSSNIIENITKEIRETLADKKAVIGLSGGVDSSTAAILTGEAIGKNLTAVYVDTGLMRYKETAFIKETFSNFNLNLKIVHAKRKFFQALKGVASPEKKRKIIGRLFVEIFEETAKKENAEVLIQGTIYSDRIESGITPHSSMIKSHHNVGGLPQRMKLQLYEPLRNLYKDEVRNLALALGLPDKIIARHVFPGPGLAVRIIGEVTPKKAEIVRKASFIIEEELKKADLYQKVWMAFAVLLPVRSVGIQGDKRSYKYPIVVRIIESKDAMTANFAKIPYPVLERISTRIANEIDSVNRVIYDISNKPPATMEWE